ncbi:MAG: hypothetical protein P8X74_22520 [Reinekea sp.]|jgi:hypothetical protein
MKWILLALLVVNLGFGGYQYWLSMQPVNDQSSASTASFNNLQPSTSQLNHLERVNARTPPVQQVDNRCIRIDGLNPGDGLEVVESRLKALEASVDRQQRDVILRQDFQVIAGPYASADLAKNDVQVFAKKGIESYVIGSGSYTNSLSLGVFTSNANASRKVKEAKRQGIDARIVVKDHNGTATSLVIGSDSASLINDETLSSVLSSFKNSRFSRYRCN